MRSRPVDSAGVQDGGDLIELLPGPQPAVVAEPRLGPDEVHAPPLVQGVEMVVLQHHSKARICFVEN